MRYEVYRSRVDADGGVFPDGPAVASLEIDDQRQPHWQSNDPEFEGVARPSFESPMRFSETGALERFEPYSSEAMRFLEAEKMPACGFVLVRSKL